MVVVVDLRAARFCGVIGIDALDPAVPKARRRGAPTEIVGMDEASRTLADPLARHETPGVALTAGGH